MDPSKSQLRHHIIDPSKSQLRHHIMDLTTTTENTE